MGVPHTVSVHNLGAQVYQNPGGNGRVARVCVVFVSVNGAREGSIAGRLAGCHMFVCFVHQLVACDTISVVYVAGQHVRHIPAVYTTEEGGTCNTCLHTTLCACLVQLPAHLQQVSSHAAVTALLQLCVLPAASNTHLRTHTHIPSCPTMHVLPAASCAAALM